MTTSHPDWPGIRLLEEQRHTEAACEAGGVWYSHACVTRLWPAQAALPTVQAWRLLAAIRIQDATRAHDKRALRDWKAVEKEWGTG